MTAIGSFAVWITGLPASGKSAITAALVPMLRAEGLVPAILESDALRTILTPHASYSAGERDRFYEQMALIGAMLAEAGIPVILDATANRRSYRDRARSLIRKFLEIYVDCPLETCAGRDPKGIYASAAAGHSAAVPGVHVPYEPPISPDLVVSCGETPQEAALRIVAKLKYLEYL